MSDSESDDIDCQSESSSEEEKQTTREALVTSLQETELEQTVEAPKETTPTPETTTTESNALKESTDSAAPTKDAPRKKHKEDFDWDDDIIGNGAFGEVKLAVDKETKIQHAVKILNKRQIIAQNKVEWVNREKFLLDRLRHPNIVSLYFTFSDTQNLYFVLEYCANGELLDHIRKHKAFNLECCKYYAAEIISALEFMHSKGIAHRDLKPENILLGNENHVKICDFGTAKELGTDKTARSNSFVGTAEYVCPELLTEKKAGLAADLWSLGCTIYQMLAGRVPFKGASEYLTFNAIENRTFIYPDPFPEVAKDLINQLLELDSSKRLGNRENGYAELKAHPFFEGIDWDGLYQKTPPTITPPEVLPVFPEKPKAAPVEQPPVQDNTAANERNEKLENQKKSIWARFLDSEELIVENSLIMKQRGLSKTKRQLIMTDKPRIFYVDPEKMVVKGEVPISPELKVEAKNSKNFNIIVPGRVYKLTELNGNAKRWVDSIKKVILSE